MAQQVRLDAQGNLRLLYEWIRDRCIAIRAQLQMCRAEFINLQGEPEVQAFRLYEVNINWMVDDNVFVPLQVNVVTSVIQRQWRDGQLCYGFTYADPPEQPGGHYQLEPQDPTKILYILPMEFHPRVLHRLPTEYNPHEIMFDQLEPVLTMDEEMATVPEDGVLFFSDEIQRQANQVLDNNMLILRLGNLATVLDSAIVEMDFLMAQIQDTEWQIIFEDQEVQNIRADCLQRLQALHHLHNQFDDALDYLRRILLADDAINLEVELGHRLA